MGRDDDIIRALDQHIEFLENRRREVEAELSRLYRRKRQTGIFLIVTWELFALSWFAYIMWRTGWPV